ncbi:MAG: tRNA (adenosine(37)-N6)-threonylcarbamoyltransferase complex ATPase subunit type 1 TsaE [Woeseiaceae bacterium]
MTEFLENEAATVAFAKHFAAALPAASAGFTILLEGELGAGKSTFARGLIRTLGHNGPVPSPTYTLVEPYALPSVTVYHVDLYRVSSEEELRYLGWNELDDGLRLVEWPDRAPELAEQADIRLRLAYEKQGRRVHIDGLSEAGQQVATKIATLYG